MPFDQSTITEVKPPTWDGAAIHLEWSSSSPAGTVFQIYVARVLSWHGTSRWAAIPMPTAQVRIDIGAVGPGEDIVDFSSYLPPAPNNRAKLSWLGGSYLDPTGLDDLAGFRVFGERTPGAGVDYSRPLTEITAYPGGIITDGYGLGGFGQGGFGRASSLYEWTSQPLSSGLWTFVVVSFDSAGNLNPGVTTTVSIISPPRPPAAFADGTRLRSAYDAATRRVTLLWNASPSS